MKKKTFVMLLALVLVFGIAVGGTLAWIKIETTPVVNTFTVGDINITLTESSNLDLKVIPGKTITKDPVVTVKGGSEACWLFIKIDEANWSEKLTYTVANGWTPLEGHTGVYYREVGAVASDTGFQVLANDQVQCANTLTKTELEAMKTSAPKLTFTAYAVQKDGVADAARAWTIATGA